MRAPRRIQAAGLIYHVTARGIRHADIYRTDADRHHFLRLLERGCRADGLICHAYCLMRNHYHLLLEAPQGNLSTPMHRINSGFAKRFNLEYGLEGHVFERRYRSWVMRGEIRAMEAVRYIVRNPVRAGICAAPEEWPWSSHAATTGARPRPTFLTVRTVLGWFGDSAVEAAARYREFVAAGVDDPPERPPLERLVAAGTLDQVATANTRYGYSLREISAHVGVSPATLSRRLRAMGP